MRNSKGQFIKGHTFNLGRNTKQKQSICLMCGIEFSFLSSLSKGYYCSHKCYSSSRIGKKLSKGHKEKISEALKGKKRQPFSEKWKKNISLGGLGKIISKEARINMSKCKRGNKTHLWKGGISRLKIYKHYKNVYYKLWREKVFKRDNWTCHWRGKRHTELHPHHFKSYTYFPKLRYDVSNGITLCVPCHRQTHYGN